MSVRPIWRVVSPISKLNLWSSLRRLFCHFTLKRDWFDWDWRMRLLDTWHLTFDTPNATAYTFDWDWRMRLLGEWDYLTLQMQEAIHVCPLHICRELLNMQVHVFTCLYWTWKYTYIEDFDEHGSTYIYMNTEDYWTWKCIYLHMSRGHGSTYI